MVEICQTVLPVKPWAEERTRRLPGLNPVAPGEWLQMDDAYGAQMAHRVRLMTDKGAAVVRLDPSARPAAEELLDRVLEEIEGKDGFQRHGDRITCPDGRVVKADRSRPLETCGALVQEDLVLMQKRGEEHVLTGAVLCFPASWTLSQKFMKPMIAIHVPVAAYTADIARRVQRLFDGIRVGRPMWRANQLTYGDPELHQPRREEDRRSREITGPKWKRVERQSMLRLAKSDAVVFSIHTYVVPFSVLSDEDLHLLGETR
ncbi:DUF3445 domain-containing protein [Aliiroseovarius subalbicans]|uniref:heme-dependent oxidative N-demethylase family protein n=1 Tax=Aliiroseovarius subalbicans TaxID=2925840 RepID=UPI001F5A4641|nr:DUF3445 domain-containing protein [Aliiroseovarius subalbicans]MCI2398664.1 DUF3445 domain-containing protein [Aliiroseovarius subalbicans]